MSTYNLSLTLTFLSRAV
jgi:hypothetical protein